MTICPGTGPYGQAKGWFLYRLLDRRNLSPNLFFEKLEEFIFQLPEDTALMFHALSDGRMIFKMILFYLRRMQLSKPGQRLFMPADLISQNAHFFPVHRKSVLEMLGHGQYLFLSAFFDDAGELAVHKLQFVIPESELASPLSVIKMQI